MRFPAPVSTSASFVDAATFVTVAGFVAVFVAGVAVVGAGCTRSSSTHVTMASAPDVSAACAEASGALEQRLGAISRTCSVDADCEASYLRTDSCAAPIAIAKGYDANHDQALLDAQNRVRSSCPSGGSPCSPRPMRVACRAGTCVATGP